MAVASELAVRQVPELPLRRWLQRQVRVASLIDPVRRAQIVRLLQTRDQHLPEPVRRSEAAAGFVHQTTVRESCPDCLANDRAMPGCETCGGSGHVETVRMRDPYAVEKVLPYGFQVSKHEAMHERDRQIDRLDEQLEPPRSQADLLEEANRRPDGWETARRRMYRRYDYRALDLALDQLRIRHEAAYHVIHSVFVYGWQTDPGPAMSAVAEAGLEFLDELMPKPRIRAPEPDGPVVNGAARGANAAPRALSQRDQLIRELVLEQGVPVRDVAASYRLSVSQVNRIVKGAAA